MYPSPDLRFIFNPEIYTSTFGVDCDVGRIGESGFEGIGYYMDDM